VKTIVLLFLTGVLILVLAVTNPDKADYVKWSEEQLTEDAGPLTNIGVSLLGEKYIKNNTNYRNFLLFSIYETEYNNQTIHVIGIFESFFIYKQT
jgi:DNA-binding MltR family transcriptional regulator